MKLSIIVPIYNMEAHLKRCLESLLLQQMEDYEVIMVNDGSTDESEGICLEFIAKDPKKFKYFYKDNGGLGDARNYGLGRAVGTYIGFVDSDDYVDVNMFSQMLDQAYEKDADLVECDFNLVYDDRVSVDQYPSSDIQLNELYLNLRVMVCNKIFRKQLIDDLSLQFPIGIRYEDIPFTYTFVFNCKRYVYIPKPFYQYIQYPTSISNLQNSRVSEIFDSLDQLRLLNQNERLNRYVEYVHIRLLLGSSFKRILSVQDQRLKKELLDQNWNYLNKHYPNWKKNPFIKGFKPNQIYYRLMNSFTYTISSKVMKGK